MSSLLRIFRAPALVLITVLAAALTTSGCALLNNPLGPPAYKERPVEVLYGVAGSLLDAGAWPDSILYFREVERQHPNSEWARRSILMAAYASYRMGDYQAAISDSERFISLFPGNPSAPYAYYLKAICYYDQIVDVGRDQGQTEQAQRALNDVVRRFKDDPNGRDYAIDAQLKLDRVDDHLAGKEMTVGRFYLRNGDTIASIGRFKTVLDRYATTSHAPEALYRMVEAYLTLGVKDEATRNAAILGYNFPGSDWYADAYALLTAQGVQPVVRPTGTRRVTNLFGMLPRREEKLPVNPAGTLKPPKAP
jgi:outer membrane protein assembly factor BamD